MTNKQSIPRKAARGLLAASVLAGSAMAQAPAPESGAPAMQAKYTELTPQLARNQFQRPLVIDSVESNNAVSGSAYAVINYPYPVVMAAFKDPETWCEVLILHLNTKHCSAEKGSRPAVLAVTLGKKTPQELRDAHTLGFGFTPSAQADYMSVRLNAAKGPMGTHDYRIELQAVPVPGDKTFMHLRYSYGYGLAGRLAMQGYMATVGSSKVGFSMVTNPAGAKVPVGGTRGAVERNTMRYYLAIDAYLASLSAPRAEQVEKRLQHWFDATERYPRQLHEIDREAYLSMKRSEHQRQHNTP